MKKTKMKVCKVCGKEKCIDEFLKQQRICKICNYLSTKQIQIKDGWTLDQYEIVIDNVINKRVEFVNELIDLVGNKSLYEIAIVLKELKIRSRDYSIKVKYLCDRCKIHYINLSISDYLNSTSHFCSKICQDTYFSLNYNGKNNVNYNRVASKCDYCGIEINITPSQIKKHKNHFCGKECANKFQSKPKPKEINYYCDICGNGIHLKPYQLNDSQRHYCSKECQKKSRGLFYSGSNASNYTQKIIKCDWCGKETSKPLNILERNKNNFCCRECSNAYFANITSQSNEMRERTRQISLKNLNKGIIKTDSSIQKIIDNVLINNNINFKNEYIISKRYAVDNYLTDYGLIIENQGDYWHSHPDKYPKLKYDSQLRRIKSDKAKHTYIKKYYDIEILYLWETDVNNNIELCEALILEYIKNKGILSNYESFNYSLIDNKLVLNNNIIIPYREYSAEHIRDITDVSIIEKPEYYITFSCEVCGKEKVQLRNRYDRHKHHYCSRKCAAKGNSIFNESTTIKFKCDNCQKDCEQPRAQYNANKTHFCSAKCRGLYVKTTKIMNCDNCGKEIEVIAKQIRLYNHHFCSFQCNLEYKNKKRDSIAIS